MCSAIDGLGGFEDFGCRGAVSMREADNGADLREGASDGFASLGNGIGFYAGRCNVTFGGGCKTRDDGGIGHG